MSLVGTFRLLVALQLFINVGRLYYFGLIYNAVKRGVSE